MKAYSDTRSLVRLPGGAISHIVGTWQDITEKKRLRAVSLKRIKPKERQGFGNIIGLSAPMSKFHDMTGDR